MRRKQSGPDSRRVNAFHDEGSGFRGWSRPLGSERPAVTPCVADGRLTIGGGFGSHEFHAFDAATGRRLWQRHTGDDGPTAAIAKDGLVAFNTESCTVYVMRGATGEVVWERWLGDPLLAQPAIGDDLLFMAWPNRRREHRLGAFRLRDGAPVWEAALPADVLTAPVFAGGRVYATTHDGSVHCFEASSGKEVFHRAMRATSAPFVVDGEVTVSRREDAPEADTGPGASQAGRPPAAGEPLESVFGIGSDAARTLKQRMGAKRAHYLRSRLGTPAGAADWKKDQSVGFGTAPAAAKLHFSEGLTGSGTVSRAWSYQGSRPVVYEGRVYSVVGDELSVTSLTSGRTLWSWSGRVDGGDERALTPPAVSSGRVYAGSADGKVLSWEAETGTLRWAVPLGAPVAWQPAVAGGRVFVGTMAGRLVSFETGDPADDGWPMWGGGPGHNGECALPSGVTGSATPVPHTPVDRPAEPREGRPVRSSPSPSASVPGRPKPDRRSA